ncbi:hypothetical protein GCM10010182_25050 [Actinomadura cremea]|nr:hypothetical protein GCM10010182_25050 [Actinomadura cremea]
MTVKRRGPQVKPIGKKRSNPQVSIRTVREPPDPAEAASARAFRAPTGPSVTPLTSKDTGPPGGGAAPPDCYRVGDKTSFKARPVRRERRFPR